MHFDCIRISIKHGHVVTCHPTIFLNVSKYHDWNYARCSRTDEARTYSAKNLSPGQLSRAIPRVVSAKAFVPFPIFISYIKLLVESCNPLKFRLGLFEEFGIPRL